jgi:hypothetical protein
MACMLIIISLNLLSACTKSSSHSATDLSDQLNALLTSASIMHAELLSYIYICVCVCVAIIHALASMPSAPRLSERSGLKNINRSTMLRSYRLSKLESLR